ncbi:peptidylprolyl isomerase [Massilia sp. W12]|uniref:peptidylprolyl isomerase n=2 Tax=Massilia sp. W12 TaxID=3126507 RepID=UPI0030CCFB7C
MFCLKPSAAQESAAASAPADAASPAPAPAAPPAPPVGNGPKVVLKTSMGEIVLELNPEKAPKTVENFLKYVKKGHYNGTLFHRVIDGFMIQGGGFDEKMNQKPTDAPIQNEAKNGLKNETYSIAMARMPMPHSASAQFFINVNNNTPLDYPGRDGWGYCVFGRVIAGMDVVDKIAKVETGNHGMHQNVPVKPVIIKQAALQKAGGK